MSCRRFVLIRTCFKAAGTPGHRFQRVTHFQSRSAVCCRSSLFLFLFLSSWLSFCGFRDLQGLHLGGQIGHLGFLLFAWSKFARQGLDFTTHERVRKEAQSGDKQPPNEAQTDSLLFFIEFYSKPGLIEQTGIANKGMTKTQKPRSTSITSRSRISHKVKFPARNLRPGLLKRSVSSNKPHTSSIRTAENQARILCQVLKSLAE